MERLDAAIGPPLGVLPGARFEEQTAVLPRGATLLLYRDGLIERRGEDLHDGLRRLERAVAGGGVRDVEALCDRLLTTLAPPGSPDDVALLAARYSAHR